MEGAFSQAFLVALLVAGTHFGLASDSRAADGVVREGCRTTSTSTPPFFVTSSTQRSENFALGDSVVAVYGKPQETLSDNFVSAEELGARRIARGSLVEVKNHDDATTRLVTASVTNPAAKDFLAPVRVISTNEDVARFRPEGEPFASAGNEGAVWTGALEPADGRFTYVLREDSFLLQTLPTREMELALPAGWALVPKTYRTQGKTYYYIQRCGDQVTYLYTGTHPAMPELVVDVGLTAEMACHLMPIPTDQYADIAALSGAMIEYFGDDVRISEIEYNGLGWVRLPMEKNPPLVPPGDTIAGIDPYGRYVHYQGSDPDGSDTWGKPETICQMILLSRAWSSRCRAAGGSDLERGLGLQCLIQYGDIAFVSPGLTAAGDRDPLGHEQHRGGECVDVRPFRNDNALLRGTYADPAYNRALTREFLLLAAEMGGRPIYFNDPAILEDPAINPPKQAKRVEFHDGHDNHLHVCFPSDSPAAGIACETLGKFHN